jgi:hypothetical protein
MNQHTKDKKLIPFPLTCLRRSRSLCVSVCVCVCVCVCVYIYIYIYIYTYIYRYSHTHKSKQYMKQNTLQENKKCYTTCYFQTSQCFWTLHLFFSMRNKRRLVGAACHHEIHWVQSVQKSQHCSVPLLFHAADNGLPEIH